MDRERQLKFAMGMAISALVIETAGCIWVAWSREFPAFTLIALISLVVCSGGLFYSIKAHQKQLDTRSRITLVASAVLFFAALGIGFLGYAAGV
jgi:hypothetical protein